MVHRNTVWFVFSDLPESLTPANEQLLCLLSLTLDSPTFLVIFITYSGPVATIIVTFLSQPQSTIFFFKIAFFPRASVCRQAFIPLPPTYHQLIWAIDAFQGCSSVVQKCLLLIIIFPPYSLYNLYSLPSHTITLVIIRAVCLVVKRIFFYQSFPFSGHKARTIRPDHSCSTILS